MVRYGENHRIRTRTGTWCACLFCQIQNRSTHILKIGMHCRMGSCSCCWKRACEASRLGCWFRMLVLLQIPERQSWWYCWLIRTWETCLRHQTTKVCAGVYGRVKWILPMNSSYLPIESLKLICHQCCRLQGWWGNEKETRFEMKEGRYLDAVVVTVGLLWPLY